MASPPEVSVIVPTRAAPARARLLVRALTSLRAQDGVAVRVILVVNGAEGPVDPAWADVVLRLPTASLPAAYRAGRAAVETPCFAELDEDDELLPDALRCRLAVLDADPDASVVVTNGLRRSPQAEQLHVTDGAAVRADPLGELLRGNWLLPGSWLARTDAVPARLFDGMPAYLECTFLAAQFALQSGFRFLDEPTVAWHVGSPGAESHSLAYASGQPDALEALAALPLPPAVRRAFQQRVPSACQDAAERQLEAGHPAAAFRLQARAVTRTPLRHQPTLARRILSSWWHHATD